MGLAERGAPGRSAPAGRLGPRKGAWWPEGGSQAPATVPTSQTAFIHRRKGSLRGLRHPGGGSRKDAIVWGFNIQNGKNARKLYSIFPVKVIILHRTKRKKKSRRSVTA